MYNIKLELVAIGALTVTFGGIALYLGYDGVIVSFVFAILGSIGGYITGAKTTSDTG